MQASHVCGRPWAGLGAAEIFVSFWVLLSLGSFYLFISFALHLSFIFFSVSFSIFLRVCLCSVYVCFVCVCVIVAECKNVGKESKKEKNTPTFSKL